MQIQMEVCNLNECDFLETRFIEYDGYNSFINDGDFNTSETNNTKGIVICFIKDDKPLYVYAPLYIQKEQYEKWEGKVLEEHKHLVWLKNIYWKLDEVSCVLVLRNKFWFDSTKQKLTDIWNNIIYDRQHGYEHRAPRKNKKKPTNNDVKCNIVLENDVKNDKVDAVKTEQQSINMSISENVISNTKNPVIVIDI